MTLREAMESRMRAEEWDRKLKTEPFWMRGRKARTIATIVLPSEPQSDQQPEDHEHCRTDIPIDNA